ncbi:Mur ligase family protein [Campylobacter canadensis]|uniref:Bifunctional folylpolyglutamate synthase/dihydrofolate synthase n=1 Tax=Campylobacter canadensis TaxID=449520 RepID=A0ABS7WP19_9BACT|nr:Mur ligase family protein [Campylobacter canadensis]MBZ7986513.1 bifunctional folylpolyglutamate synthase/dihydrofolate synthase [Campylobacter canadensis]MBZ7994082.1 bifunctional folylpolyglutamate synthase/dihydrofolate synthase [Campylobacter canadensis]MBZ7995915.1 bifunctional folylpolyglutamate synthase/dihydrofolate synthase [Campylobacter canadensis]MBZ7997549.1 bifunctional folylpolyglutamate synthase/dihydrofolate synthase [Campylobacter canadensis]MBZ7999413.1 bifunctional folyl
MLEDYLLSLQEHYEKFDLFKIYRLKHSLNIDFSNKQKVIQILGTNGKGSTGRYLAQMLSNDNFKVGHFLSPHILDFKERITCFNCDCNLEENHQLLQKMLKATEERPSYFEYLTLLSILCFKDCDYVVFEAGLGGEYDATSAFKIDLCVFTKISIDHCELLGNDLNKIISTKIKAMSSVNIFADDFLQIKQAACKKGVKAIFLKQDLSKLCLDEADFLKHNFSLAQLAYFELFSHFYITKAIKLSLKARCELIQKNILIDVGHNADAAENLKKEIKRNFSSKIILICNFFKDKEVQNILSILKDNIDEIKILNYESSHRQLADVKENAKALNIACSDFDFKIKEDKNYVVFGSFVLVEKFLKFYEGK